MERKRAKNLFQDGFLFPFTALLLVDVDLIVVRAEGDFYSIQIKKKISSDNQG